MAETDPLDRRHEAGAQKQQRDETCRVSLQGQVNEIEHELGLAGDIGRVAVLHRRRDVDSRLGSTRPLLGAGQAPFELANAREVLVELFAIGGADAALHVLGLFADGIEDAPAVAQAAGLFGDVFRAAFGEETGEDAGRKDVRRHDGAGAGPRQAEALAAQGQTGEAGLAANVVGRELVERDAVAEAGPSFRVRRRGQEAVDRIVAGADLGVSQAGDDREVVAEFAQHVEIRRHLVVATGAFREQVRRVQTERSANADHATRRSGTVRLGKDVE
jgi:hypothetical protein